MHVNTVFNCLMDGQDEAAWNTNVSTMHPEEGEMHLSGIVIVIVILNLSNCRRMETILGTAGFLYFTHSWTTFSDFSTSQYSREIGGHMWHIYLNIFQYISVSFLLSFAMESRHDDEPQIMWDRLEPPNTGDFCTSYCGLNVTTIFFGSSAIYLAMKVTTALLFYSSTIPRLSCPWNRGTVIT